MQIQKVTKSVVAIDVFHSDIGFLSHKLVSLRSGVIFEKLKVVQVNSLPFLEQKVRNNLTRACYCLFVLSCSL